MKIKVFLKNPDAMYNAVEEAVTEEVRTKELPEDEARELTEFLVGEERKKIKKWIKFGEFLMVEFDTEAMIATVLESTAF